ncbi:MAG TPA: response regulator, partial [Kineosporiaceae bacterium]|nr:response regulator [Kineosporiaceae bacterium]
MTTIMIVDDSATFLMSMSSILIDNGFEVACATDGQDALDKVASVGPDLIITDLNMPVMDGLTFIKQARRTPGLRFTPMLMLTSSSQESKRQEARAAGAAGWLVKPISTDELLAVICQVVVGVQLGARLD